MLHQQDCFADGFTKSKFNLLFFICSSIYLDPQKEHGEPLSGRVFVISQGGDV